jgi:DnaJ-class molecular chaperone
MSDVQPKNYYEILGLPRSANDRQIDTAYRALAMKYHPDTSHGQSNSAPAFREITEAFDVLSNPEKRRRYDRLIRNAKANSGGGLTIRVPVFHGHSQSAQDAENSADVWRRLFGLHQQVIDDFFGGRTFESRSPTKRVQCELPVTPEEARQGATVPIKLTTRQQCVRCAGKGTVDGQNCNECDGNGFISRRESLAVALPRGITDGTLLQFERQSDSEHYHVEVFVRVQSSW